MVFEQKVSQMVIVAGLVYYYMFERKKEKRQFEE
jgi:hypothetical protein